MGVAHVGLVHRDPCECKVKGFRAVSFIERNVSKRRHLQGVRHCWRPPVAETAIFTKSGHVHVGNWPTVTRYAFLLQAMPVSNSTIALRPG